MWPEMLENAAKMRQKQSNHRQLTQACGQKCSKMLPKCVKSSRTTVNSLKHVARNARKCCQNASKAVEPPSTHSSMWPEMLENAAKMRQKQSNHRQLTQACGQKCSK